MTNLQPKKFGITQRAMRFILVALFLCGSVFAKDQVIFYVVQGDQNFEFIDRRSGRHEVNLHLQYEILSEIRQNIVVAQKDALLFFDPPNLVLPFVEFYQNGILIRTESIDENFTDSNILAQVLNLGYEAFPNQSYVFFQWGYTIPFYPISGFDLSHPNATYDLGKFRTAFQLANASHPDRKFEAIILSTCFNSSLETLYALSSFTRYVIGSEIYLNHFGFASQFETPHDVLQNTLSRLEERIPVGPASKKPVMDVSVTLIDLERFWDFHDILEKIFYDLGDQIGDEAADRILFHAFQKAALKNSRNKSYLGGEGLIDLKTLVLEVSALLDPQDLQTFEALFSSLVLHHEKLQETNDTGLHFYVPFQNYVEMQTIQSQMNTYFLRGTYLDHFFEKLFEKQVTLFGLDLTKPFPNPYTVLLPYFQNGYVNPALMRKIDMGLRAKDDVVIQEDFEITLTGTFEDTGHYWRKLGTHRLKTVFGQEMAITEKTPYLFRGFLNQTPQKYTITGNLYMTHGLWSKKRGLVFQVTSVVRKD